MSRPKNSNKKIIVSQKPSLTLLILKTILDIGTVTVDSFFPAKYSQAKMWRDILGLNNHYKFSKTTFAAILSRLQKDGLVERSANNCSITTTGKKLISTTWLRKKQNVIFNKDGIMRLVIFDIPEKNRKARLWLRLELTACEYKILQKSVWVGYCPLPAEFFEALDYMNLRNYVHIFSIKNLGTLKKEN